MSRILIASSNPWSFCMAVEREVAALEAEAGATVDAVDLYRLCARSSPHPRGRDKLVETLNRKIDRFVMPAINGRNITADIRIDRSPLPAIPPSYQGLRDYAIGDAKIGLAVLSSVSSLTTIQTPSSLADYGRVLSPAWRSAHRAMRIGEAVRKLGYDRVWIFNGRHCSTRPFCDVLEENSQVIRYEQGSAGNRYIWNAGSIHHPRELKRIIEAHDFDPEAGESFFRDRLNKHRGNEVALMTATQQPGALPPGLIKGRAVTFFTSSSDEVFAIRDDPPFGDFPTQHHIALALADICRSKGLQLVVRLHPHLRFKHRAWTREWDFDELRRRGALVLAPEDAADSYAIVRASQAVVTAGSTIGFEAVYAGVPSADVGSWLGGQLGVLVETSSAEDLGQFIANPVLLPNARERALLFGSFFKRGGKLLPELDVGTHPNFARIAGRIVDPIRFLYQRLKQALRPSSAGADELDIRTGMRRGRVLLPPGTDYRNALSQR